MQVQILYFPVSAGVLNALGWLVFCLYARRKQPYVWRCALSVVLALAASSLEILDFAPILWAFDAHALWHLSTALLPFLWYKFITDDCQHLQRLKQRSEDLGDQKERGIKEKDKDLWGAFLFAESIVEQVFIGIGTNLNLVNLFVACECNILHWLLSVNAFTLQLYDFHGANTIYQI